jgi:O-antigen/teichoic acid export membrane protein
MYNMSIVRVVKNSICSILKDEGDRKKLSKVILPSFFIHFIAGLLYVLTLSVLTRKLGARQYGILTYAFTVISLTVGFLISGITNMATREPPALLSKGKVELWKGFYIWSYKLIVLIGVLLPLLMGGFIILATFYLHILGYSHYTLPILCALPAVPFLCLMNYYSSCLRGQYKSVLSFLPDNIVKPVIFLVALVCFLNFNIWNAIWARDLSFAAGAIFAIAAFYRTTKMNKVIPQYDIPAWKSSLKSFFILTVVINVNLKLDILMLGFYRDASEVGIYSLADRVAVSIAVFQMVINQISTPSIARLHALNEKKKLQNMVVKISRWVTIISLPFFLIIVFFGKWILSFFGPAFVNGQNALIIICIGQLIGIAFGPGGNFLVTTKNERLTIIFALVRMAVIILLNSILTPVWGIVGTAIATAASIIIGNAGIYITIKKRTGISTWIFG